MNFTIDVRPEVAAFALLMEAKLRENDHKRHWRHDEPSALLTRLREETAELDDALDIEGQRFRVPPILSGQGRELVGREAADVANFAMMIADVCGALRQPAPPPTVPPGPFGPFADKAICEHAWEPHVWEQGARYCPRCDTTVPPGSEAGQGEDDRG